MEWFPLLVYDKASKIKTLANDGGQTMNSMSGTIFFSVARLWQKMEGSDLHLLFPGILIILSEQGK